MPTARQVARWQQDARQGRYPVDWGREWAGALDMLAEAMAVLDELWLAFETITLGMESERAQKLRREWNGRGEGDEAKQG